MVNICKVVNFNYFIKYYLGLRTYQYYPYIIYATWLHNVGKERPFHVVTLIKTNENKQIDLLSQHARSCFRTVCLLAEINELSRVAHNTRVQT